MTDDPLFLILLALVCLVWRIGPSPKEPRFRPLRRTRDQVP